jgi:Flp pilus assembly protein TadD
LLALTRSDPGDIHGDRAPYEEDTMPRTHAVTDHRPQWITAALITVVLAACGGKETETPNVAQAPVPSPSTTPVTFASGPTVTTNAVAASLPVTFAEGETLYKEGKFSEAKVAFSTYVERKPENAFGHYMLGLASWKSGDLTGAEKAFNEALAKDPKHVKSLLNSARVLMDLDRNQEALERITTARTLDSTSTEPVRLLARAHHRLGDVESAVKAYREALVGDERDVWAMNNLGMLYIEQRKPQDALGPLARAVQLKPTSPIFQNNLGMTLELLGDLTGAKQAYDDALKADSTYAKAKANAERLGDVVVDSTRNSSIIVSEVAEVFRQQVKMW